MPNADQRQALDVILAALAPAGTRRCCAWRDGQRQDRGLHPGHPGGGPFRPAGDRAGAGDQSHAANGRAFQGAVREVAVLHSHLGDAQRHWHWQQIASGKVSVWSLRGAPSSPPRRTWA